MKFQLLANLLPDVYKEAHSNSFEKLFRCSAKNLCHLGLNFQSNEFNSTTHRFRRILTNGFLVFCVFLVTKELIMRKWKDEHYFNLSFVVGTVLLVGPRILQMFLFRKELNELIEQVAKTTQSDCFSYLPDLESQLYTKYLNISRLITRVLTFGYHFMVIICTYLPIVTKEWFLLLFTVTPWLGYQSHPGYEISLILETYVIFSVVGFMVAFDSYFYYFTFYVLMKSDLHVAMVSKIGDFTSEYNTEERQSLLIRQLCLIQLELQNFLTKFTKIFGVYVLGQGAFSLVTMTSSLLTVKSSFLNFFMLFSIVSTQLFFLCLFGELVLWKASAISNGIYCSEWYNIKSIGNRKMLLHLLHNSQKKMTFSAMGVYDFSLATFAAIIQKAYGYYAFMQNIK